MKYLMHYRPFSSTVSRLGLSNQYEPSSLPMLLLRETQNRQTSDEYRLNFHLTPNRNLAGCNAAKWRYVSLCTDAASFLAHVYHSYLLAFRLIRDCRVHDTDHISNAKMATDVSKNAQQVTRKSMFYAQLCL